MTTAWVHQQRAIGELRAGFSAGHRRGVLVIPTGGGKTHTAWLLTAAGLERKRRCLFVADRRVLVYQAARSARAFGLPVGVVMADAGDGWRDPEAPVQVVSKDTLVSWMHRPSFDLPPADLLVVDECHRSIADTWEMFRSKYPDAWEVGLTATPCRADGKGLGRRYEFLCQPTTYAELQGAGVLVRPECYAPGVRVTKKHGPKPSRDALVGDAVRWREKWADGLRTFCFCADVAHSIAVRDEYRAAGVAAEHIDGHTDDATRDDVLARLAAGELEVVTNCNVLRYGVDVPSAECLQILCPMGSVVDYRQSAGRVLRSAPGKSRAVVIDHSGAVLYHGFPDSDMPWTLDDDTDHVAVQRKRMEAGEERQPVCCPECHALFSGRPDCPGCGWVPKKRGKKHQPTAGQLYRVEGEQPAAGPHPADLDRAWRDSVFCAAGMGRSLRVAGVMFKKRFGRWPDQNPPVSPLPRRYEWDQPAAGFRDREFLGRAA